MLDIRDMSEEDKLFNFLSGLQTWAQTKLRRQGVKDLLSAIAAADRLVDFWVPNICDLENKKKDSGKEKGKSSKGWKDGKFKKKKHQEVMGSENKETVQPNVDRTKKGCYLCNGDHRMRDCPKRGKLNALVAEADYDEGGSTRVNPLVTQHLAAVCSGRHAAHNGRTGLANALAELGSVAQHLAAVCWSSTAVTLASELHGSVCASLRHFLYLLVINARLGIFPSKLKTSAVRLRERADWFGRNQAAQWAEQTEDS
ncbi:hypothetical protein Sango_2914300 [Sesamum angolense]|uniref:Uncharacterized protein n=1 Tax=Sesamum angolense TaxID=2727404 RepID=A0AAE1T6B5_9LAMI|nr:hypothetical protein Sango_2914300 [Sesamum angolense]